MRHQLDNEDIYFNIRGMSTQRRGARYRALEADIASLFSSVGDSIEISPIFKFQLTKESCVGNPLVQVGVRPSRCSRVGVKASPPPPPPTRSIKRTKLLSEMQLPRTNPTRVCPFSPALLFCAWKKAFATLTRIGDAIAACRYQVRLRVCRGGLRARTGRCRG